MSMLGQRPGPCGTVTHSRRAHAHAHRHTHAQTHAQTQAHEHALKHARASTPVRERRFLGALFMPPSECAESEDQGIAHPVHSAASVWYTRTGPSTAVLIQWLVRRCQLYAQPRALTAAENTESTAALRPLSPAGALPSVERVGVGLVRPGRDCRQPVLRRLRLRRAPRRQARIGRQPAGVGGGGGGSASSLDVRLHALQLRGPVRAVRSVCGPRGERVFADRLTRQDADDRAPIQSLRGSYSHILALYIKCCV